MKTFSAFLKDATSVCNNSGKGKNCPIHGVMICPGYKKKYTPNTPHPGNIPEENLHKWFQSKSKDDQPGWVNVVTGGTCASDEPGEGVPKCVSSEKRASMTPEERRSAARRKKQADPNQQQKSGAAKPTYVATDKPKKKLEEKWSEKYKRSIDCENPKGFSQKAHCQGRKKSIKEESDKKGKGSGKKDACYHKVKSRYRVWPSAYASGALVKCRKVGADNWGTKSEEVQEAYLRIQERGTTYSIMLNWRGKVMTTQMFFPQFTRPSKGEVVREIRKIYPGAIVIYFNPSTNDPTKPLLFAGVTNGPTKNRT